MLSWVLPDSDWTCVRLFTLKYPLEATASELHLLAPLAHHSAIVLPPSPEPVSAGGWRTVTAGPSHHIDSSLQAQP